MVFLSCNEEKEVDNPANTSEYITGSMEGNEFYFASKNYADNFNSQKKFHASFNGQSLIFDSVRISVFNIKVQSLDNGYEFSTFSSAGEPYAGLELYRKDMNGTTESYALIAGQLNSKLVVERVSGKYFEAQFSGAFTNAADLDNPVAAVVPLYPDTLFLSSGLIRVHFTVH